ncbi:MAG TPA: sigma-54 dependent transcriptional regulator [Tepidisphaeraceae bacterium]|jgi:DNA-binding NtrC family response regulator
MARILIVDDEANMRRILGAMLRADGHEVSEAGGTRDAIAKIERQRFDLVITDQKMSDGTGLEVLAATQDADPALPVVILTAFATVDLAVEALRHGAFDFLTKPFTADAVRAAVGRAVERIRLRRENELLKGEIDRLGFTADLLGESAPMQAVKERIARVAPTNATVMITGDTGTGKELAARAIHRGSNRSNGPFLPVNCAAFPETLLDSELFGHERGAFTGADRSRPGWFEAADGGTLFLDEAGEMSLALQAKLLRVLTDHQILRIGSRSPRAVDVRVIAATHRDLKEQVRTGEFREDLYYRIAVVPVEMPPLRERREDIPTLVDRFLADAARELKVPRRELAPAAMRRLQSYAFPGNIRELRNLIERACILAQGDVIVADDFPLPGGADADGDADPIRRCVRSMPPSIDLRLTIEQLEKQLIARAMDESHGVQAEAARRLGLSRGDVGYKLRKYALGPPDPDAVAG